MAYLVAGPLVAIIGIVAVFFVLRRKSVEQRSMYSARRSQIEHKVRAARQRTLAPHGHPEKPPEPTPAPAGAVSPFDQAKKAQPTVTYDVAAYQAPPAAPPAPPPSRPERAPEPPPWEQPPTPAPAAPSFDYPPVEPFRPAPEPTPMPPSEPSWTPAPSPAEPLQPAEPVSPAASVAAASSTSAGGWSVVSTTKESAAEAAPSKKKKNKGGAQASDWSLASGDAPGMEADEPRIKGPSAKMTGIALYAIMVVGLVMVLLGVLIMVANSHVT